MENKQEATPPPCDGDIATTINTTLCADRVAYDYGQAYLDEFTSLGKGSQDEMITNERDELYPLRFYRETLRRLPLAFGMGVIAQGGSLDACERAFRAICGPPTVANLRACADRIITLTGEAPTPIAAIPRELLSLIFEAAGSPETLQAVCRSWRETARLATPDARTLFAGAMLRLLVESSRLWDKDPLARTSIAAWQSKGDSSRELFHLFYDTSVATFVRYDLRGGECANRSARRHAALKCFKARSAPHNPRVVFVPHDRALVWLDNLLAADENVSLISCKALLANGAFLHIPLDVAKLLLRLRDGGGDWFSNRDDSSEVLGDWDYYDDDDDEWNQSVDITFKVRNEGAEVMKRCPVAYQRIKTFVDRA
jgi:hypothetical protein